MAEFIETESLRSQEYFAEIQICASMFQTEPDEAADCPRLADLIARLSDHNAEGRADVR